METIVRMVFGSHLYGTDTPDSDLDYKGVFMPSREEILLGRIPKSHSVSTGGTGKNTKDDVDTEMYSLHHFIKLACDGETVAIDMLHAPNQFILETSPAWDMLRANRRLFYTRSLKAFVGYARRQAAKYGIRGSRLNEAKMVMDFLSEKVVHDPKLTESSRLSQVWDGLPVGEHLFKHEATPENNNLRMYEVCGRKYQETAALEYTYHSVREFYSKYGARAEAAAKNEGIDWKACSHALRAAYQVKDILVKRDIVFPLPQRGKIKAVKMGLLDYKTEFAPELEMLMSEVERLSAESDLPEKVDRKFWDEFTMNRVTDALLGRKV